MKKNQPVAKHLKQLSFERAQSFALPLLDRTGPLSCDRLLQLVPKKRASFHGHYFNDEVVAKLYFSNKDHTDRAQEEIDGLNALQNAGCLTPAFLYAGLSSDQAASIVLLKWMPNARTLFGMWPDLIGQQELRQDILNALAVHLAQQHMAGISLREPHLSQYMWHDHRILCIDGGRVEKINAPLNTKRAVLALAPLLAHFAPRWDPLIAEAMNHYAHTRYGNSFDDPMFLKTFWGLLTQFRIQYAQIQFNQKRDALRNNAPWQHGIVQNTEVTTAVTSTNAVVCLELSKRKPLFSRTSPSERALCYATLCHSSEIATAPWLSFCIEQNDVAQARLAATQCTFSAAATKDMQELIRQHAAIGLAPRTMNEQSFVQSAPNTSPAVYFNPALPWVFFRSDRAAVKQWKSALRKLNKTREDAVISDFCARL